MARGLGSDTSDLKMQWYLEIRINLKMMVHSRSTMDSLEGVGDTITWHRMGFQVSKTWKSVEFLWVNRAHILVVSGTGPP